MDTKYITLNGQVWMRSQEPEGERWVRLNRTRKSEQTTRTTAQILRSGPVMRLTPEEWDLALDAPVTMD